MWCSTQWNLFFPTFTRGVIFLIFKELDFLEKMFFKNFDQPNNRKIGKHPPYQIHQYQVTNHMSTSYGHMSAVVFWMI